MLNRSTYRIFIVLVLIKFSCLGQSSADNSTTILHQIKIDTAVVYQSIDNFGASDAWSCQFVGLWPKRKKEKIASLLFSKEVDLDGNPKGIGLSLWRFNLGAGSSEQEDKSNIKDEWRRAESFINQDGSYNFEKQKGQVWFAKKAREYNVGKLLLFANSPPVILTKNNKAFSNSGTHSNLDNKKIPNYAEFLANSVEGLTNKGLHINYISPLNEPQWDWADGGQEGTPFWNNQIAALVRSLNSKLIDRNLETKIDIAEAAKINYLSENDNKQGRGNQIEDFFNPNSKNYIGNLSNVSRAISGHSYFSTSPESKLISERKILAKNLKEYDFLKFWMSEYCILGDNDGEIKGNGRDLGIESALYMAKVIHHDLTVAQASAWHWWLAISPYDYKDGLIYIDKNKKNGNFYESKMLWTLGNYSRFIKPGSKRVKVSTSNNNSSLLYSAYHCRRTNEIIIVVINNGEKSELIHLKKNSEKNLRTYTTSSTNNLAFEKISSSSIKIPKKSIVTIIQCYKN